MRHKIPLQQKIVLKLREIPALWKAKKEEKKHLPTTKELLKEEKQFERNGKLMRRLIMKKK